MRNMLFLPAVAACVAVGLCALVAMAPPAEAADECRTVDDLVQAIGADVGSFTLLDEKAISVLYELERGVPPQLPPDLEIEAMFAPLVDVPDLTVAVVLVDGCVHNAALTLTKNLHQAMGQAGLSPPV